MESKPARGTHFLERLEVKIGLDIERKQANKGHSLPGEGRDQDCSGPGKEAS